MRTLILLMLLAAAVFADDPESTLSRIRELHASGRYGDAEAAVDAALGESPGDPALLAAKAELLLELGRYEEAGESALLGKDDPRCRTLLGESLLRRGRVEEARKLADKVIEGSPDLERARFLLGRIHLEAGDREKAFEAFDWFFDHYAVNDIEDPEALTLVAEATVRVAELRPDEEMDFHVTMKLLDKITKEHEDHLSAYVAKGELYLSTYQDQDAKKWFEKALQKNSRYPPALLGLAKQQKFRFNELGGVKSCQEAILTNPNLFEAKEFIARVRIGDGQYDEARKLLDEILEVNPRRKRARGLLAAIDFCLGKKKDHEKKVAAILAQDARYGGAYRDLAEILEEQRRFEEAAAWAEKACSVDPDDYRAWWQRGRNLVHLAKEKEAREALQKSLEVDPFAHYWGNPIRENMIEVLGHLEEFVESRTENFIFKIHVGENAVLTKYYHRFMERSWRALTEKYGFKPEGPILTEVFHLHSDFAARTIGLPGIGALGACFGKVITLDSPSARDPGQFTWAATAHHEFAHVMTLQLSKGRVPRWFTEGMSVYEERKFAKWWERDMDRRLFDAYRNDQIHEVARFNQTFRGGDVLFSYYLGGMMCEFLEEEFGFPKIVEMLKAYGEDKQTPAVLKEALGVTTEEYDRRFKQWVGRYVSGWKLVPKWSKKSLKSRMSKLSDSPKDLDALVDVAWAHYQRGNSVDAMSYLGQALAVKEDDPRLILLRGRMAYAAGRTDKARSWYERFLATGGDDLEARLHLAQISEKGEDFAGAISQFQAAKACFPSYIGAKNPYLEISRLKRGEGDLEGSMAEIEALVTLQNTAIAPRLDLADFYENRGEWKKLAEILGQIVEIYPLGEKSVEPVHLRLAGALTRLSDLEGAVLEYEVALELGVSDEKEPAARVGLGEVYFLQGRLKDARYQASAALERDPDFAPAKELLEKIAAR